VRGGVPGGDGRIIAAAGNPTVDDQDSSHRHFAGGGAFARQAQGLPHKPFVRIHYAYNTESPGMPELEIHHESHHEIDPMGQKVGVLAAILAVALAIVTIASHRTHTAAIIHKSAANDSWQHYQSTRVKYHNLELGEDLLETIGSSGERAAAMRESYATQKKKYDKEQNDIQQEARRDEELAEADEHRALRYDLGEGLLEIALVLSSLYFISHKRMFPVMGVIAGIAGAIFAITGLLV
jgi:hypothetical protein